MPKEKSNDLYRNHAIRGYRLSKALEKKNMKQAELLRQAKAHSIGYFDMSAQTLNMIIHGKRPLRYEDAEIFAEILGVKPGYLMGSEDSEETKQILVWEKEAEKYNALLNQINANIFGLQGGIEDEEEQVLESYLVIFTSQLHDKEIISVSHEDMDNFYQDVCSFIKKRFDILIDLGKREA